MSSACLVALVRTRGRAIFLFNPLDGIPITAHSKYQAKLQKLLKFSNRVFIVGHWKDVSEDYTILRSAINVLLEWLLQKLFALAAVRESAQKHARTFLMTRETIKVLYRLCKMVTSSYDVEMVMVNAKLGLEIRAAKLDQPDPYKYTTSSYERVDQVLIALHALFASVAPASQKVVQKLNTPVSEL
jgi:hypothetical protein